ncbi:MAG: DNA polymerase III subunit alpha, partial [Lachnospiraceae bacterium]|nr:DNA polymerase III subunit alpha [Lachnospiraceae bacterium]
TRKQFMSVYVQIMENISQDKKNNMAGQLSLFDIAAEEEKESYEIKLPDVGEYSKDMKLGFEKEVLGIYVSGHPLEEYQEIWRGNITNMTSDFVLDEDTNAAVVKDGQQVTIGGIVADKRLKYTKNEKVMAFLQIEDLVGSVEVIVFPKDYEKNSDKLIEDKKVFVKGRVSAEDDKDAKLICEKITAFDEIPKKLWIKFPTMEQFEEKETELMASLHDSEGRDSVVIYIENPRAMKKLPPNQNVNADEALIERLEALYGKENVRVV